MQCPRCSREGYQPYAACGGCGFSGAPGQVEELGHVAYVLGEIDAWRDVLDEHARERLRARYQGRRRDLELALGLRRPPPTPAEVRALWQQLGRLSALDEAILAWGERGWMKADVVGHLRRTLAGRTASLREALAEVPGAEDLAPPDSAIEQRARVRYFLQTLERAHRQGLFVDAEAYGAARAELVARRRALEVAAGLRPAPLPATPPVPRRATPPSPPEKPREPITWERLWQTLLSERTLNVLLFLGAFLLMAAATTYVVYNWEMLPPVVQLSFIALFTLAFYAAGWFLRVRMDLWASGIAVTAIGSLLVPLDFYAIFLAGGLWPESAWPWVWLMASAVCLPVYFFTALRIRAKFFGYLVAVALGSLFCAALEVAGAGRPWWLAAVVGLSFALTWLAYRFRKVEILAGPFRFSALVATSAALPLGLAWWLVAGVEDVAFDASLAVTWSLGTCLYGYSAWRERSGLLGTVAATSLPVALALLFRLAFEPLGIEPPWYAPGWALLSTLYLWVGHRWLSAGPAGGPDVRHAWGRTATGWSVALAAAAGVWAVFDLWAAAATYAVLAGTAVLLVRLHGRPRVTPLASLLALASGTFAMAALHLQPAELCLGWALLALAHVLAALRLRLASGDTARASAPWLFAAAPVLAALAVLPPLLLRDEPLLTYAVGHWIGIAAWLLWLDRAGEDPALGAVLRRLGPLRPSALHWAVALPMPFFAALVYTRVRVPDAWLGIVVSGLAWLCFAAGRWEARQPQPDTAVGRASLAWYVVAYSASLAGIALAFYYYDQALTGFALLLAAALYFLSAWALRFDVWLIPGGLALPLGLLVLLDFWGMPWAQQSAVLAATAASYLLGGVWLEERHGVARGFMASLYAVAHLVAGVAVFWGLAPVLEHVFGDLPWPDTARLWAAAGQLVLGAAYGLFAWFHGRRAWAHTAAWLGVMAGGLVATAYSQGRGSSAFKAALLAAAYVLAERALASGRLRRRWRGARRAWLLYARPLLYAGWTVSAGAVVLALVRNLILLGGGLTREMWAVAGTALVAALYFGAGWFFRRRRPLWFAAILLFVPCTILTLWGWFVWPAPPEVPRYALAWALLASIELAAGIALTARRAIDARGLDYGLPLRAVANGLMVFALVWGVADSTTSSATWGVGLAFYLAQAVVDRRRGIAGWQVGRFLYPATFAGVVWSIYLLHRGLPGAPYALYGSLLLAQALPLLAVGRWLDGQINPASALPVYLGAYGTAAAGTLLVAHRPPLLAAALVFDTLLCLLSAWRFRRPEWGFPAAALGIGALVVALAVAGVPVARRGWWLLGLGADYLGLALLLRARPDGRLRAYATAPLAAAFAAIALGLVPSSLEDTGAFWGYLAAALLYAIAAIGLRQPLLLAPAAAMLAVPYGVGLIWLAVPRASYGVALFPGVSLALAGAHFLDRFTEQGAEPRALVRLPDWWAASLYAWAYAGALVAVGLSWVAPLYLAAALGLAAATFLHATWRFHQRGFLLVAGLLAQAAVVAAIDAAGWLDHLAWVALAFLPATLATGAVALAIEIGRGEGSPLRSIGAAWSGWSRPLYLLLVVDVVCGQLFALTASEPGTIVTAAHALLLAALATVWAATALAAGGLVFGVIALFQGLAWAGLEATVCPVALALLGLAYGLAAYALFWRRSAGRRSQIWRPPLEWGGLALSAASLVWAVGIGLELIPLIARTFLGQSVGFADYAPLLRTAMWVMALTGLLYLAAAVARRLWAVGYGAVALLLASWALWWRFFQGMAEFQWYAVPAGLYLLGVGWIEWQQGHRGLARWIDRAGVLVWLGSAWWQSLPGVTDNGWPYALLMGAEALLLVWWGSARRQRRFLYTGVVGVVVTAVTQSIEPLLSADRWIVFGIAGSILIALAVLIERKLEAVRAFSLEMRERLESWD
ncbi:MAG: hypothetical protein PVG11_00010 [Anaerolineae bacterium]